MIGVGLVTPGEEFSCDNALADQLIEQGRATLVDDNGRTADAVNETVVEPVVEPVAEAPVVTEKKSKTTLEAEVAADAAALATAEAELAAPESA